MPDMKEIVNLAFEAWSVDEDGKHKIVNEDAHKDVEKLLRQYVLDMGAQLYEEMETDENLSERSLGAFDMEGMDQMRPSSDMDDVDFEENMGDKSNMMGSDDLGVLGDLVDEEPCDPELEEGLPDDELGGMDGGLGDMPIGAEEEDDLFGESADSFKFDLKSIFEDEEDSSEEIDGAKDFEDEQIEDSDSSEMMDGDDNEFGADMGDDELSDEGADGDMGDDFKDFDFDLGSDDDEDDGDDMMGDMDDMDDEEVEAPSDDDFSDADMKDDDDEEMT